MQGGKYKARATAVALGETSTGKEQIVVAFSLVDTGESISWYGYFTERTLQRTYEALKFCGWEGEDLADFDNGNLAGLDANEVEIVVEEEIDQDGTLRARVRWVNQLRGCGIAVKQPLTGARLKAFSAKMKGEFRALNKLAAATSGTKPTQARRPTAQDATEDAPPF